MCVCVCVCIYIYIYIYIWSDLRELCGSSTAHDARAHEPNTCPTPSKFEFEVIPFGGGQSGDAVVFS